MTSLTTSKPHDPARLNDESVPPLRVAAMEALLAAPAFTAADKLVRKLVTTFGELNFVPSEHHASRWHRPLVTCSQELVLRKGEGGAALAIGYRMRFADGHTTTPHWVSLPTGNYAQELDDLWMGIQLQFWPHFQVWKETVFGTPA